MSVLDLHHTRHNEVSNKVIRFIEDYWDSGQELEIVTGSSNKMQWFVIKVLDEYKLNWYIGDYSGLNRGFIRVQM